MRLYIGTLYSGENELEACIAKVQSQTYRDFEHFVFRFLPNKEAHDTLFRDFLSRPEFGILVKIDADLVLREDTFFERVVTLFRERPDIDLVEFVVYDQFEMVVNMSLNCYRQGFGICDKGPLFVDRITDIPKRRRMVSDYVSAVHCPNPSDYQAFHFGFHAQLKERHVSVANTFRAYLRSGLRSRGLALCGALAVMRGQLGLANVGRYADPRVEASASQAAMLGSLRLWAYVLPAYLGFRAREQVSRGMKAAGRRLKAVSRGGTHSSGTGTT